MDDAYLLACNVQGVMERGGNASRGSHRAQLQLQQCHLALVGLGGGNTQHQPANVHSKSGSRLLNLSGSSRYSQWLAFSKNTCGAEAMGREHPWWFEPNEQHGGMTAALLALPQNAGTRVAQDRPKGLTSYAGHTMHGWDTHHTLQTLASRA